MTGNDSKERKSLLKGRHKTTFLFVFLVWETERNTEKQREGVVGRKKDTSQEVDSLWFGLKKGWRKESPGEGETQAWRPLKSCDCHERSQTDSQEHIIPSPVTEKTLSWKEMKTTESFTVLLWSLDTLVYYLSVIHEMEYLLGMRHQSRTRN